MHPVPFLITLSCFICLTIIGWGKDAHAQSFKERHLVLTKYNQDQPVNLLPYLYITEDPKREVGTREFVRRLRSRLPGNPVEDSLLNFSFKPYPHWLSFQLTNEDATENWVLDFGTIWQGRSGIAAGLFVMDARSGKMLLDALPRSDGLIPDGKRLSTQLPITIPRGHTAKLIVYILPTDTTALTMPMRLVPAQNAAITNRSLFNRFDPLILSLSLSMLFFTFCLWFKVGRVFFPFILFFAINLAATLTIGLTPVLGGVWRDYIIPLHVVSNILLILWMTHAYLQNPPGDERAATRNEQAPLLIYIVAAFNIFGLLIFFFILPQGTVFRAFILQIPFYAALLTTLFITLSAEKHHQRGAKDLAAAWLTILVGHAVGLACVMGWLPISNPLFVQAPTLSIALSTIWLISAAMARFATAQDITIKRVIRKAQQAQSNAQIKQSKENADQARLLRIIEREREIMEELRQRDAQRTEDMQRAVEAADEANKAKSAFLAVVSHEIRTPMTGIMGMLRLLRGSSLTADQTDYVQTIEDSGDAMMALLNDILDFSKIQGGGMVLEQVDFDLIRLINGVSMLMSGHATQKGIELKSQIGNTVPQFVRGDPTRLRQILLNLAGNAIKFTSQGSVTLKIERSAMALPDGMVGIPLDFAIIDTGIGISEEAQLNLFSPFAQADTSIARKYGGTGLGLAICKTLIEAMGADIKLKSKEGQGTTFSFTVILPEGQAAQAIENQSTDKKPVHQSATPDPIQEKSILVVDDNAINRKVIASMIEPMGHHITMLDNAEEVLTLLNDTKFDLILMDIELPGLRGDEASAMIRSTYGQLSDMPIIGLTGHVGDEEVAQFKANGMNAVLHKPIDPEALERAVNHNDWSQPLDLESDYVESMNLDDDSFNTATEQQDPFDHQTTTKTDKDSIFDPKALEILKTSLPPNEMDSMLSELFTKADEITEALRQSYETEDFNTIRARAHEIKGMCGNFGMIAYSRIAGEIEDLAQQDSPNTHHLGKLIAALPEAQLEAQAVITQWLSEE